MYLLENTSDKIKFLSYIGKKKLVQGNLSKLRSSDYGTRYLFSHILRNTLIDIAVIFG
jgi:hypothetical protein